MVEPTARSRATDLGADRRVLLRLVGSLEQGFQVVLEVSSTANPFVSNEMSGTLPPAPELAIALQQWQRDYRQLPNTTRIQIQQVRVQTGPMLQFEACRAAAAQLQQQFQLWLTAPGFQAVEHRLREWVTPEEPIRVLLRCEDWRLHSLPWHRWEFFERYPRAEVAMAMPAGSPVEPPGTGPRPVKILAILGDGRGIDTEGDRRLLESLPGAAVMFLVEPDRAQITDQLWQEHWDILFFAGHSSTQIAREALDSTSPGAAQPPGAEFLLPESLLPESLLPVPELSGSTPLGSTPLDATSLGEISAGETSLDSSRVQPLTERLEGHLGLNPRESLTLEELKFGLRHAIHQGLQLAVFNSCDGLGLAQALSQLQLPQLVVMRQPIPDQVAQTFLRYFLQAFAAGESLYSAVRQARERLQGLEGEFPNASWLPMLYQNPAAIPPTWSSLARGGGDAGTLAVPGRPSAAASPDSKRSDHRAEPTRTGAPQPPATSARPFARPLGPQIQGRRIAWHWLRRLGLAIAVPTAVATAVLGLRSLGLLQPWELKAYDQLMRSRPIENPDARIVLVTIDDEDIQRQGQGRSLSDANWQLLLQRLAPARVIGVDLYRDFAVDPKYKPLATQLANQENLVLVCKTRDLSSDPVGVNPPPEVAADDLEHRVGFSDFLVDQDGILRRQLLFMSPDSASRCAVPAAFSTQLALHYLKRDPEFTAAADLQIGHQVFPRLRSPRGGYQQLDDRGGQVMLNYRTAQHPVEQVSLREVLAGQVPAAALRDRLVLVGVTALSNRDRWATPYGDRLSQQMPGVLLQAQMTSHLLSTVLDHRPLIWTWSPLGEIAWIGLWCCLGTGLGRLPPKWRWLALVGGWGLLWGSGWGMLLRAGWIPLVPAALGFGATWAIAGGPGRSRPTTKGMADRLDSSA